MSINLWNPPATEEDANTFLQEHGLLPKERICAEGHKTKLYIKQRIQWNCSLRVCCKKIAMQNGTWFSDRTTSNEPQHNSGLVQLHEEGMCAFNGTPAGPKIGGPGKIVEIDESLFSKRKNHSGRILPPVCIFGGLCRETGECFLTTVLNKKFKKLTSVIIERIEEVSTIYSDSWRPYKTSELKAQDFAHLKVNHKYRFVDPESGAHTPTIEKMLEKRNEGIKSRKG